jgi:hypothetical protein
MGKMHKSERKAKPSTQERGQTTLEFALVIGTLFLVVFGIIEFSRLFFAYGTMSQGVREAARYGIIHPGDDAHIVALAESKIFLIGGTATVDVAYPDSVDGDPYCAHLCRIVITAKSTFNAWTPLVPDFEMLAQATMHIE